MSSTFSFRKNALFSLFFLAYFLYIVYPCHVYDLGDNDHKHGPHFHDVNYHVHDARDEAHMKKREHWLEQLEKTPEQKEHNKHERRSEMLRHEARREQRQHEFEEEHGRYANDDERAETNKKIVDAYEKKQLYLRKFIVYIKLYSVSCVTLCLDLHRTQCEI